MVTITSLMRKDHIRIGKLLGKAKTKATFQRFRKSMVEHFELEEKAIFTKIKCLSSCMRIVNKLLREHRSMRGLSFVVQKEFDTKLKFKSFKKALLEHSKFETSKFYPILDKQLPAADREKLIKKLKSKI